MNTRSFAVKCGRLAPKYKVKKVAKEAHDMPQAGSYDVRTTLQDYRVRDVQMAKDLPRNENVFLKHGSKRNDRAVDSRPAENYWTGKHI